MLQQGPPTRVFPDAASLTVADYLEQWLSHSKGRVRAKTHDGYRGLVRLYAAPALARCPWPSFAPWTSRSCTPTAWSAACREGRCLNLHVVLTQALSQAVRWGLIAANPAARALPPRPPRPERAVDRPGGEDRRSNYRPASSSLPPLLSAVITSLIP